MARLTFHGGAGTVTGVNVLVETDTSKILLDCGLLQREHSCVPENERAFAYKPADIDVLLVSHAHADHIGRIPKLVKDGFKSFIYSTAATKELAALMFEDTLHIMQDATHAKCRPFYLKEDVAHALSLWKTQEYHEPFSVNDLQVEFFDAGHILGSAMIRLTRNDKQLLFTGDLGNSPEPLLPDTESPKGTSYLIMESVYGDRVHSDRNERREHLKSFIEDTRKRKGTLIMPSFSLERTQILLHEINDLQQEGMQPIPLYLDSPLSIRVMDVYRKYGHLFNTEMQAHFSSHDDPFSFEGLHLTASKESSRAIFDAPGPKVIVAGSGMSSGGRVRAHERRYVEDRDATILFVGYQAPGSLGRELLDGAREVDIDGERLSVRAEIAKLSGYSGHKDRDGLITFVEATADTLEEVFVAMGEPKAASFLAQRLHDFLGVSATVPKGGQSFEIAW